MATGQDGDRHSIVSSAHIQRLHLPAVCRPKITVRWTPGEASELHGECATQEVELAREGGQPQRQSCPGRALECTFSAALPAGRGTVSPMFASPWQDVFAHGSPPAQSSLHAS